MTRAEEQKRARSMHIQPRTAHMRTFARRCVIVACLATAAAILVSDVAWGRPAQATPRHNGIDVVKVDGLLDPPTASLVRDAIRQANQRRSTMIVLQLDSGGSVDVDVEPLLRDVRASRVPVVVWVGPSGAKAKGAATVVGQGLGRRRQPNQEVRFGRLDIANQLLHTLISPSIAYLLFLAGLALMVFEFYTCGIGLAGLAGAAALIGALVGFSHLPVAWWAAALLMLAVFGFAVDVQAGGLGVWTFIGGGSLVAGSLTLYGGDARLNPPWWVLAIVIVGTALFMLGAMTAVIRSRFSTPTIGREGIVGEEGRAEIDVAPDGVVVIQGARWRARTNRATPIDAGDPVRVVAVEGLVLEVEPEEGGARDYRDRSGRRSRARGSAPGDGTGDGSRDSGDEA